MQFFNSGNLVASAAVMAAWLTFGVAVMRSRASAVGGEANVAKRDLNSVFGIALQGCGMFCAWVGPIHMGRPITSEMWIGAAALAVAAFSCVALFAWSTRTMGANWSLVARTLESHSLVQTGPFAFIRNPIYVALFGMMCATAVALGHQLSLIAGIPVYLLGTVMRVRVEEKLLRDTFGQAFDDYARRVKRFIPGLW